MWFLGFLYYGSRFYFSSSVPYVNSCPINSLALLVCVWIFLWVYFRVFALVMASISQGLSWEERFCARFQMAFSVPFSLNFLYLLLLMLLFSMYYLLFLSISEEWDSRVQILLLFSLGNVVVPFWCYLFLTGFTFFLAGIFMLSPYAYFYYADLYLLLILFWLCEYDASPCDLCIMCSKWLYL